MTKSQSQSQFDSRVAELRASGTSRQDANRIALAEERARNEQIADQTYRRT